MKNSLNNTPFFSVIIPLYNKEDYIKATLKSVINQTFQDFEIIIVNDGSTDNSLEVTKKCYDNRIKIISQENKGLSAARNAGIKASKANYFAFLDADDLWAPDYLETQYNLIKNHLNEFIFTTNLKVFTPNYKPNLNLRTYNPKFEKIITNYFKLCENIFGPSSLVIKRELINDIGYFNETITYGEGDEFYIKCFSKYNLVYYTLPKVFYRIGIKNQLTAPNKNSERIIPDYNIYLNGNNDLKKYIDFVHYKLVVLYKMEKNYKKVRFYKRKIKLKNLSLIKQIKFLLPTPVFYNLKLIHDWLSIR